MKVGTVLVVFFMMCLSIAAKEKDSKSEVEHSNIVTNLYLTGTITDATSGECLVGVKVKLEGTDKKVYTDFDGKFTFEDVKPGEYNISAEYISYTKGEIKNQNINALNTKLNLELNPLK